MSQYKIHIQIETNPVSGDTLSIINDDNSALFSFTFYAFGEIPPPNGVLIDFSVYSTMQSLRSNFDQIYNLQGLYVSDFDGSKVTIVGDFSASPKDGLDNTDAEILTSYTLLSNPLTIDSYTFLKNITETCNKINVQIVTSVAIDEILKPTELAGPASGISNTLVGMTREQTRAIVVKNAAGDQQSITVTTPSYLNDGKFNITKQNNSILIEDLTSGLNVVYSLTNSNFTSETVFADLAEGDYTLYIKDEFDCSTQIDFSIEQDDVLGSAQLLDEFIYSEHNCVRLYKINEIDNVSIFKNKNNTKSCNDDDQINYTEIQEWNSEDIFKLQFKTGYDDLSVITSDNNNPLSLDKISNNIGLKEALDSEFFDLGNNKMGIYFISGTIWNYDDLSKSLGNYSLNGELPIWAVVGNIVTIDNFNYLIEEKNSNADYEYIVISRTYVGDSGKIKCKYNIHNYEVYESFLIMRDRETFSLDIFFNGKVQYSSEFIRSNNENELALIQSTMKKNTDMFFASGIKPFMRLKIISSKPVIKNITKQFFLEESASQTKVRNYQVTRYVFEPMTKARAEKLVVFLTADIVFINGINLINDSIEKQDLGESNLVEVKADMIYASDEEYKRQYELFLCSSELLCSESLLINDIIEQ